MGQAARACRFEDEAPPEVDPTPAMEQLAADELSHALAHEWTELRDIVPWADHLPAEQDRPYHVVRSFRWADVEDGDMVCEVTVHELPDRRGHVIRRTCVLRRD